jgi:hypothetical protein
MCPNVTVDAPHALPLHCYLGVTQKGCIDQAIAVKGPRSGSPPDAPQPLDTELRTRDLAMQRLCRYGSAL